MQLAQTPTMRMRNDRGGDGDDSATFHLFGAAFLNPGCTLESPQVFFFVCLFCFKYLIRTPPQTSYFGTLMVRLAPALVFLKSSSDYSNVQAGLRAPGELL